nr:L,D-transpeptidase family protein [Shewanella sp. NIFS-20-20]
MMATSPYVMANTQVDLVKVTKSTNQLQLFHQGQLLKSYHIALGDNPVGHKLSEGDERTPEGRYILDYKKADSAYYRSIHISYPNDADKLRARALGQSAGGLIMIHGENPDSELSAIEQQQINWTNGCIAVTNQEMDELWQLIEPGTPIEIYP